MLSTVLRTSEFWMGLFVSILNYLTSTGLLPPSILGVSVESVVVAGLTYVLGRIFGKTARAALAGKV